MQQYQEAPLFYSFLKRIGLKALFLWNSFFRSAAALFVFCDSLRLPRRWRKI